jgi:YHS domain-containing protein
MADVNTLIARIDAEFTAKDERIKEFQKKGVRGYEEREARLEKFGKLLEELSAITRPRLEALAKSFKEQITVTPTVERGRREGHFAFKSELAQIELRFSVTTDQEVTKVIFNYDLRIIPILMQFEPHAEVSFPIDRVDKEALAKWVDDRIVTFVRTYLSLHENEYYLKGQMVEDPVAHVRFPKAAAASTLESGGKTYYFLGEETRREFEKKHAAQKKEAPNKKAEPAKVTASKKK